MTTTQSKQLTALSEKVEELTIKMNELTEKHLISVNKTNRLIDLTSELKTNMNIFRDSVQDKLKTIYNTFKS